MKKSNKVLIKDTNLTETFFKMGATESEIAVMQDGIDIANKAVDYGELFLQGGKSSSVGIYSKILINADDANKETLIKCEDSIKGLAVYLQTVSLGVARSLNDEYGMAIDIRSYVSTVVTRSLTNAQGISLLVKQVEADNIVEHLIKQMNKLDEYDIYSNKGREGLINHVLDSDYWETAINAAFSSVVKDLDAKALRIALLLGMNVL